MIQKDKIWKNHILVSSELRQSGQEIHYGKIDHKRHDYPQGVTVHLYVKGRDLLEFINKPYNETSPRKDLESITDQYEHV